MSTGPVGLKLTQSEATAGQRTFSVHLTLTADGANAVDIGDLVLSLSKAGAALGAAAGSITQKAAKGGWYDVVLAVADLDVLGDLAYQIAGTGVDTLRGNAQVTALDHNVATVSPADGALTAAKFAADAITAAKVAADVTTELQNGLATAAGVAAVTVGTVNRPFAMGTRTTDGNFTACSMKNAIKTEITVTGTWNGATVTGQVSQDNVTWQNKGTPLTADGVITLTGPAESFRAVLSDDGASTSLTANAQIVNPA
jgi:hypothetical protein